MKYAVLFFGGILNRLPSTPFQFGWDWVWVLIAIDIKISKSANDDKSKLLCSPANENFPFRKHENIWRRSLCSLCIPFETMYLMYTLNHHSKHLMQFDVCACLIFCATLESQLSFKSQSCDWIETVVRKILFPWRFINFFFLLFIRYKNSLQIGIFDHGWFLFFFHSCPLNITFVRPLCNACTLETSWCRAVHCCWSSIII